MLLSDKEAHRIERLFRLLQLRFRGEDVRSIHGGLSNADRRVRAASRELLENLLEEPLRGILMALVDDLPPEERLARIPGHQEPRPDGYQDLLAQMAAVESPSLRSLADLPRPRARPGGGPGGRPVRGLDHVAEPGAGAGPWALSRA
jgi:hypothetical protein